MCIVMVISSRYDLVMVGSARGANKWIKAGESDGMCIRHVY